MANTVERLCTTAVSGYATRGGDAAFSQITLGNRDREDVGEDVGVVECGLYAIVCVGKTSDIVGVRSVGETSAPRI